MVRNFRRKKPFFVFFPLLGSQFQVPQALLQHVARKYSQIGQRRVNIKSYLSPNIHPTLKLSNYKAITKIIHAVRTKAQLFTPSYVDRKILHTCSVSPCRLVNEGYLCVFFSSGIRQSLRPKYPQRYVLRSTTKYLAGKKKEAKNTVR